MAAEHDMAAPTSSDDVTITTAAFPFGVPRYERKFMTTALTSPQLEHLVRLHPAMFSRAFPARFVNNIYLDTPALDNFHDNVVGRRNRLKVRIRWYGPANSAVERPVLELKRKDGLVGWKAQYPLAPFELEPDLRRNVLHDLFARSDLPVFVNELLRALQPTLLNRYQRRYYVSADRHFRVTVDSDLSFRRLFPLANSLLGSDVRGEVAILELKYAPEFDHSADSIANRFPIRVTKSSKYVSGLEALGLS